MRTIDVVVADVQVGKRLRRLNPEKVTALCESITEIGLRSPISVTEDCTLIAGLHRLEAFKRLGRDKIPGIVFADEALDAELAQIDENLIRAELTVLERGEHLARRKEIYEARHPETKAGGDRRSATAKSNGEICHLKTFAKETADKTGTAERTVREEVQISRALSDQAKDLLRDTPTANSKTDLLKLSRLDHETQRQVAGQIASGEAKSAQDAIHRATVAAAPPIPEGLFDVIYADPPWAYNDRQGDSEDYGPAEKHYPSMSLKELSALAVPAADNAVLFLWATSPLLPDGLALADAWGFVYKASFIWDKIKHNMGHYNSVRHEFLLVCTRGSHTPQVRQLFDSVQSIERTGHSEKPEAFRQIIEILYPQGAKLEMFARKKVDGWVAWGNQA